METFKERIGACIVLCNKDVNVAKQNLVNSVESKDITDVAEAFTDYMLVYGSISALEAVRDALDD